MSHLGETCRISSTLSSRCSPWENGYNESFNGTLRRELLDREVFDTLLEAQVMIEKWRCECNHKRPHSSLGNSPPTPYANIPFKEAAEKIVLSESNRRWNNDK
jgi:transposase InsO family protein